MKEVREDPRKTNTLIEQVQERVSVPCWGGERLCLGSRKPRKQKSGCRAHSFTGKAREKEAKE